MAHKLKASKSGAEAPISVTPQFIGQIYRDTVNNKTYISSSLSQGDWEEIGAGGGSSTTKSIVTVGTAGADYDNFDDAIDYLRTINGGTIIVTSNMTITSTAIKDITNITIDGNKFYSGTRQINKIATSGYWYGKNVVFKNIWFYRLSDAGANEIFKFTEDYQDVTLDWITCVGLGAMSSPTVFNCNGKEAHVVSLGRCGLGTIDWSYVPFTSPSTLVLHIRNGTVVNLGSELVDACWYDASCEIQGTPTWNTPDHPIQQDAKNALIKNTINGTFTTTDGKTVTVVDGQVTDIS